MTPNHPSHISFGVCPKPDHARTNQLHRTMYDYAAAKSAERSSPSTFDSFVPVYRIKTMAEIDREKESRRMKAKKGVKGAVEWIEGMLKGKKV
jgi:hypothetical protein